MAINDGLVFDAILILTQLAARAEAAASIDAELQLAGFGPGMVAETLRLLNSATSSAEAAK